MGLFTKVSPEEKAAIDRKMELLGTSNLRAYLRKMAVDGYIVQLDMSALLELVKLLRSVSSNVNQIARRLFFIFGGDYLAGVTKEQIAKAKEWDLLSYLQTLSRRN